MARMIHQVQVLMIKAQKTIKKKDPLLHQAMTCIHGCTIIRVKGVICVRYVKSITEIHPSSLALTEGLGHTSAWNLMTIWGKKYKGISNNKFKNPRYHQKSNEEEENRKSANKMCVGKLIRIIYFLARNNLSVKSIILR